jgi:hypothetical protein
MAKTKVAYSSKSNKSTPAKAVEVQASPKPVIAEETTQAPLTGKALLQKVKELSHLAKRETAEKCGYVKMSVSGDARLDLSGFYDAVLAAKGVYLDGKTRQKLQKQPQLENRVATLETEPTQMKKLLANFHQPEPLSPWWLEVAGSFENDPDFDEAVRLGQEWRKTAE